MGDGGGGLGAGGYRSREGGGGLLYFLGLSDDKK